MLGEAMVLAFDDQPQKSFEAFKRALPAKGLEKSGGPQRFWYNHGPLREMIAVPYRLARFGTSQQYGPVGTGLVIAAGLLPDLDGVTILGGWRCHNKYHRVVGHGLPFTVAGPVALTFLGALLLPAETPLL